jgi:hypothetical protein
MKLHRKFELFADYFQLLLIDASPESEAPTAWSNEAVAQMLAFGLNSVSLGTLRNIAVAFELYIEPSEPPLDLTAYDHVAVGSLSVPSGELLVMGCTDSLADAVRVQMQPGTYQFAYLVSGVETITAESEPADDRYTFLCWPGPTRQPSTLKEWKPSA